ncbi:MAG: hypothetical protein KGJ13_12560, partial [Patescibacteria group bacterium]|nr:hypothetical protein [Patescibacteria group bacterium]
PTNLDPLDLTCLTHGERLFLWRRAQRAPVGGTLGRDGAGLSRAEAAAAVGATLEDWDRCEIGAVPNRRLLKLLGDQPPPAVGELCRIARRRSGVPLAEIEATMGVARPTLHRMERVGYPRLIAYWQERGYRFPG